MSLFTRIADHRDPNSIASKMRRKRLAFFAKLLAQVPRPVTILDVGGTVDFWRWLDLSGDAVEIIVMNLSSEPAPQPHFSSIAGDARDLSGFADKSIDIVYSNSVIEHVGTLDDQLRMANEVRRVGKRYFVQTPNAYFPIEPHFLVPGFQFMPLRLRTYLLTKFRLGWLSRQENWENAMKIAASVRLLTLAEVKRALPEATVERERFAGLTKSIIAYHGW